MRKRQNITNSRAPRCTALSLFTIGFFDKPAQFFQLRFPILNVEHTTRYQNN